MRPGSNDHNPIRVGVSACLVGEEVRFDGGHKRSSLPHEKLQGLFEFVPICPEVAIGLGIPREPIRLVQTDGEVRVRGVGNDELDVTDALRAYARETATQLTDIHGYVFMKNSPSCGLSRVKVFGENGAPLPREGRGAYADEYCRSQPNLPVEESGRMFDAALLENFATRVFVHARFRDLIRQGLGAKSLIGFHSAHKYLVMAHSTQAYRELGRMLADLSADVEAIAARYFTGLMQALAQPPSRGSHANVLSHLQGYVKNSLSSSDRQSLAKTIDAYREGSVPLLAPIVLLKHHLQSFSAEYALSQVYLDPHPAFAGLRREL